MMAYLYILWAVEDGLVKVGISKQLKKRLSSHTGNASNPLKFQRWKVYQFSEISTARKVETLVLKGLSEKGFGYRGKRELFKCSPTAAADEVAESCSEASIHVLKNIPIELGEILQTFVDFPCLPDHALELLTPDQQSLYRRGVQEALWCLSYLEGIKIRRQDLVSIGILIEEKGEFNSELWSTIIDHYRDVGSLGANGRDSKLAKSIAWSAHERMKVDRQHAYADWQELYDDDQ